MKVIQRHEQGRSHVAPLGGWGWGGGGAAKKKKSPPTYIEILNGPPHFCSFHSQHALVSIVGLFYPLIKPKHGPLIFKYPKALPNKITLYLLKKKKNQKNKKKKQKKHFITHSQSQNWNPFFVILFILFQSSVYTPLLTSTSSPQTKQKPQLNPPLRLSPHNPKKRKLDHYFLPSCFLKINHSGIQHVSFLDFRIQNLD